MPRRFVPIPFGSMAKAGDIPHLSPDISEELKNVFHRPGPRIEKRPAWKSDVSGGATTGKGLMKWRDKTSNTERLVIDNGDIEIKDSVLETWGAAIVGAVSGVTDYTNYHDALYWMAKGVTVPNHYKYDGTALDTDPFRESISSLSIVAWKDRLWMFNVSQNIWNRMAFALITGVGTAYGDGWSRTNVNKDVVVSNGVTTTQWTCTDNTNAKTQLFAFSVAASTEAVRVVFRADIQGLSPLFRLPMTMEVYAITAAPRNTAVLAGVIRVPTVPNGFRYRAANAGTTAVAEPVWDTTGFTNTADGGVTWINDGPDAFASHEFEVGTSTDNAGGFQTEAVMATIPAMPDILNVGLRFKWGNTSTPTGWQFVPIVVGLKDGLADGDPRKRNYGMQVTVGQFDYEFFNQESSVIAPLNFPNRIIATEAGLPKEIRADMWWEVVDGNGPGVVLRPLQETMCAFKRESITTYRAVEGAAAARLPMQYEATFDGVGCISTRGIDAFEGLLYFIGEQGVYSFDGQSQPNQLVPDELREAIFDRGANWVENNSSGGATLSALLRIDEKNREIRIYTQIDRIWVYNIDTKKWTSIDVTKDANAGAAKIVDLAYHRNKFYAIADPNQLVREDTTATQDDVAGVGSFDVTSEVWLHPFETIPRGDQLIEEAELHHKITGDQTGATLEAAVSFDRGATFPKQYTITVPITTDKEPIRIPLWQSGPDLIIRLRHKGKAGASFFNLFWAGVWVQDLGAELNDSVPATVSASL